MTDSDIDHPLAKESAEDANGPSAERYALSELRLGCTMGAPITPVIGEEDLNAAYLETIESTGLIIPEDSGDERARLVIEWGDRVIFHTFDPQRPDEFVKRCMVYANEYGEGSAYLGGPGMVAMLDSIRDLPSFMETMRNEIRALLEGPDGQKLRQIFEQPTVVRVEKAKDVLTPEARLLVDRHMLNGFAFGSAQSIEQFQKRWSKARGMPQLFFEGNPQQLIEFYESGNRCEGYIATVHLEEDDARKIRDARVDQIAREHNQPIFSDSNPNEIRIGVVALQGAYHLEQELVESMGSTIPECAIKAVLVHTRQELQNLDAVVLGGGWHGPQLRLYNDPRLDIIEGVREHINKGNDVLLSCAGAIAGRNPRKQAKGCSSDVPAGFIDINIDNNRVNGAQPIKLCGNGEWSASHVIGHFSAGPAFEQLGDRVQPFAKLEDDTIVGVEQKVGKATILAVAAHNRVFILRLMKAIIDRRWAKRGEAIAD